jgi:hypothetical protein
MFPSMTDLANSDHKLTNFVTTCPAQTGRFHRLSDVSWITLRATRDAMHTNACGLS